jgi:hypothetical protein
MFSRFIDPFRQFGLVAGLLYTIDRVLGRISGNLRLQYFEILVQPIPEKPLLSPALAKRFEVREIRAGDAEIHLMPARTDIKEQRFRQNAMCLGAFDKGRLAGYIWLCFRQYEEDEARCTFILIPEQASVFDFDLYIFPQYRMGLAFMAVWHGANEYLRGIGVRQSYSRLTRFNLASRRAHEHLGARRIAHTCFLQAWRLELMFATIWPYVHFSVGPGDRVRLRLRPDR